MRSRVRPRTLGPSGAGLARGRRPPGWLRVLSACAWLGDGTRRTVLSSVRVRLILWYVAILALVLLLFSSAIYVTERQALLSQLDGHINARLRQLSVAYDARSPRLTAPLDAATVQGDEIALLLTPAGQILQIQAAGRLAAVKVPWDRAVQILATA
ncbi:MAG TPA: hypothetical protein VHB98_02065, partial [Chloroflexota bacterium]|nr:hypothetical protein [Chloroflexota bacterium]